MGLGRRVEMRDRMVEEVDGDGEVLCSILEVEIGIWRLC
jgi:hypothetical protein